MAALTGDTDSAAQILAEDPASLEDRFSYETMFKGAAQEGSGQAIHLAASRNHLEIVKLLFQYRVDLDAVVTRTFKPHYNVLHAAVFAEGRGGDTSMVRYLLSNKASNAPNANEQWPIHVAFQTGSMEIINLLTNSMQEQGFAHVYESKDTPLAIGIRFGKMSEEQLARAAPLTPHSLKFFSESEPGCIPSFMKRLVAGHVWTPASLAEHVSGVDISKVLRSSSQAASALLDGLTGVPECESTGWWPLPSRVSFAPRGRLQYLRSLVNPPPELLTYYQTDSSWKYDVTNFECPEWHKCLTDRTCGKPIVDASIKVCHVPNIVCAEFFSALVDASGGGELDDLHIYRNLVVQSSISQAWWHGACTVDMAHVLLTVIGLFILVVESSISVLPLDLGVNAGVNAIAAKTLQPAPVASAFLGAKGAVDLLMEIVQLAGYLAIGQAWDYLTLENLLDLWFCAVQMYLFADPDGPCHRFVMVCVVFLYWCRLGNIFKWAENIARALLPIQKLVYSLGPASVVTVVGFCAFTHAFYLAEGQHGVFWTKIVPQCFSTLISAELPNDVAQKDALQGSLTYMAAIIFSIFFMNVFIGVIGQQYEEKKEMCHLMFQHQRANACCNFLVRARVLPCSLASKTVATSAGVLGMGCIVMVPGYGLMKREVLPWTFSICVLLQMMIILSAYQNPSAPWASTHCPLAPKERKHYLWTVVSRASEEKNNKTSFEELKSMVLELKEVGLRSASTIDELRCSLRPDSMV